MNSSLNIQNVRSVAPAFSWDNGNFSVSAVNLSSTQQISGVPAYVGYSPNVCLSCTSVVTPSSYNINSPYLVRAIDFGDYYNSSTNVVNASGTNQVDFKHTYIMPGLYSVTISNAEYSNIDSLTWNEVTIETNPALLWPQYTGISATTLNGQTVIPNVTAATNSSTVNFLISVVEIMPTAYLSSNVPSVSSDIVFPLTVTLTPRYTQTGSFPIEKIVWDLGDGSPLITKTRWDNNSSFPFVSTGALSADLLDPRNFDVVHTYTKPDNSVYSFYPSITAYTFSTGSNGSCAVAIGPILATQQTSNNRLNLLQTDLGVENSVIIGQVGTDIGVWKTS
jgi:hypothetical protein